MNKPAREPKTADENMPVRKKLESPLLWFALLFIPVVVALYFSLKLPAAPKQEKPVAAAQAPARIEKAAPAAEPPPRRGPPKMRLNE